LSRRSLQVTQFSMISNPYGVFTAATAFAVQWPQVRLAWAVCGRY